MSEASRSTFKKTMPYFERDLLPGYKTDYKLYFMPNFMPNCKAAFKPEFMPDLRILSQT